MNVSFNGYGQNTVTFAAQEGLEGTGIPVRLTADGTVGACAEGDVFCGILIGVREGFAAVQLSGYAVFKTTQKLPAGYTRLCAGADGTVTADSSAGRELLVVSSTDEAAGIIL